MREYYIAVKMRFGGELYTVSGPYDSFEDAENDLDTQMWIWEDSLDEDEYLGVVVHEINESSVDKKETIESYIDSTRSSTSDSADQTYSQGHHLFPWILLSIFCFGLGIPFIIYYSVSPNHHWE